MGQSNGVERFGPGKFGEAKHSIHNTEVRNDQP